MKEIPLETCSPSHNSLQLRKTRALIFVSARGKHRKQPYIYYLELVMDFRWDTHLQGRRTRGQQYGSVKRGACCQAWRPKFNFWYSLSEKRKEGINSTSYPLTSGSTVAPVWYLPLTHPPDTKWVSGMENKLKREVLNQILVVKFNRVG